MQEPFPEIKQNDKRIAKNTIALFIRMMVSMFLGLFTTRIVLKALGVEDYGIYGVVSGVVVILNFLNISMSAATSRFITYALGRNNTDNLRKTFTASMMVHIIIALAVLVIAETVGLWFLLNKLVIPAERMFAAQVVYQFGVISSVISIVQVPYNATVIAQERMNIYAYIEILKSVLLLGIAYLTMLGNWDRLIIYGLLYLLVITIIFGLYYLYCHRNFIETKFYLQYDKQYVLPIFKFAGWDLYGNACMSFRQQGNTFLINMFYGVTYNSSNAIATQVCGAITYLIASVVQAYRPQIIKNYAVGNIDEMQRLMRNAAKYSILLTACVLTPCVLEMPYILDLWLTEIPPMAIPFCRVILFYGMGSLIVTIINTAVHATGNIRKISFISGSIFLLSIVVEYVLFKMGFSVMYAYYLAIVAVLMTCIVNTMILKKQIAGFKIYRFVKSLLFAFVVLGLASVPAYALHMIMEMSFLRLVVVSSVNLILILLLMWLVVLDKDTKELVKKKICQKYRS